MSWRSKLWGRDDDDDDGFNGNVFMGGIKRFLGIGNRVENGRLKILMYVLMHHMLNTEGRWCRVVCPCHGIRFTWHYYFLCFLSLSLSFSLSLSLLCLPLLSLPPPLSLSHSVSLSSSFTSLCFLFLFLKERAKPCFQANSKHFFEYFNLSFSK